MRLSVAVAFVLLAGCSTSELQPLRPLEIPTAPYNGIITAGLTGSLMYEGGCLLFRDEPNRIQVMPVWPDGSSFNGTSVTLHVPGKAEQRLIIGEELMIEGQPLRWSSVAGPRSVVFDRQCHRQPFAVLRVHPAN